MPEVSSIEAFGRLVHGELTSFAQACKELKSKRLAKLGQEVIQTFLIQVNPAEGLRAQGFSRAWWFENICMHARRSGARKPS